MEILNVIKLSSGIMESINSFPVVDPENKEKLVTEAEAFFIEKVKELQDDVDEEFLLDEGYFDDGCGNEVLLVWSE